MKMIPLLIKEGSGVVARNVDAATHYPLSPLPLRRGAIFIAEMGAEVPEQLGGGSSFWP
jgi:hypothetical protein